MAKPSIKFIKHWFHGRQVLLDGVEIGKLEVVKNGWTQKELKRGSASQVWSFYPTHGRGFEIGSRITGFSYYTEIKEAVRKALSE